MTTPSNLPTIRRFKFEDFQGAPDWFNQFLATLNLFSDPMYQIVSGNVTYQNLAIPKTFTKVITAPASGNTTFNFANPLKIAPSGVLLGNVYVNGNPSTHPSGASSVYWHFSQGNIYIDNIVGLTASTTYVITLVIL